MASYRDEELQLRLGQRCREVRQQAEMSQLDVVRHHEFSLSHLQKIERGVLDPKLSTLARLAQAYGVSLSDLLDGV